MALTMSQAFLGALTVGIGLSRGVEADLSFHVEDLSGEANFAASRVAAGHAKAANAIADDNTLAAAAMAPRLAVESDVITMDESAKIACAKPFDPIMARACQQYQQNKPRAVAKRDWIRQQQSSLWSSLEKLSAHMDRIAGQHGRDDATAKLQAASPGSSLSFDDPTASRETWGHRSASTACDLAAKDAQSSEMVGHAFPLLMPTVLEGMPRALVGALPRAMCNVPASGGASAAEKKPKESSPLAGLGLTSMPDLGSIGGSTRSPSAAQPNESDDFRACASASRAVDSGTSEIAEAARQIVSFGDQVGESPLKKSASRTACGKWYFPTGNGSKLASVPKEQQAFVPAWRHTLVAPRGRR